MLCEQCGEREATVRIEAVSTEGTLLLAKSLCAVCADEPMPETRRIGDPDVRGILELEATGRAVPDGLFAYAADEFAARAARFGDPVPSDVQAFIDRHRVAPGETGA